MKKRLFCILIVLFLPALCIAADPRIETIGPFQGNAPENVKAALSETGYRVLGDDGKVLAEIWPAKIVVTEKNESSSAIYPDFVDGAFYGLISLPSGTTDLRGQNIPTGTYTMRYQLLPGDGNHMGVAPDPDFFLLLPADLDPGPTNRMTFQSLVRASAKASGTAHPAAFALASPDARGVAAKQESGHTIAYFPIGSGSVKVPIGMILSGAAE